MAGGSAEVGSPSKCDGHVAAFVCTGESGCCAAIGGNLHKAGAAEDGEYLSLRSFGIAGIQLCDLGFPYSDFEIC